MEILPFLFSFHSSPEISDIEEVNHQRILLKRTKRKKYVSQNENRIRFITSSHCSLPLLFPPTSDHKFEQVMLVEY